MRPRTAILLAAALVFVVTAFVPFGRTILYPLSLFTTWVHEMGHGLTALAVGGEFRELSIFSDGSGLASCAALPGVPQAMVSLGGLLAPPIVGAAILALVHGPRRARVVLGLFALALIVSMVLYVRSIAGLVAMPLVALALGWSASRGFADKPERRTILAQVLGVMLAIDTLTRMVSYVFTKEVKVDGAVRSSDITNVANNLGGHYVLWGIAVTVAATGLLALGVWWAWGRQGKPATAAS
jgi:Peptidase M50B-like